VTAVKVVDASAIAALLFGEPEGEAVAARLQGARLAAPRLLEFEIANVCLNKCKRHPEQQGAILTAFRLRDRLGVEPMPVDCDEVLTLAQETDLTAYDACYLWLSKTLAAELVTLDRKLLRASAAPG